MLDLRVFTDYRALKAAFHEFPDDAEIWKVSDGAFTIKPRYLELEPSRDLVPQYVATVGELRLFSRPQPAEAGALC